MSNTLTAEAFGTLLALAELGRVRTVPSQVAKELVARGLAEQANYALLITPAGRRFTRRAKYARPSVWFPPQAHVGPTADIGYRRISNPLSKFE